MFGLHKLTPTTVLHDKANLDKLEVRRVRDVLLMAQSRASIDKYVYKRELPTRTHSQRPLIVPNGKSEAAKKALGYRSAKLWNALPGEMREVMSRARLKTQLRNHIGLHIGE